MTNPIEFNKLPLDNKSEILRLKGKFRGIRQTLETIFGLYELNGFFVEVTFSIADSLIKKIDSIEEPAHFNYSLDWHYKQAIDKNLYK